MTPSLLQAVDFYLIDRHIHPADRLAVRDHLERWGNLDRYKYLAEQHKRELEYIIAEFGKTEVAR